MSEATRLLVRRYLEASLARDGATLRSCLAHEIEFDWGVASYRDPDAFVSAVLAGEVRWREWREVASVFEGDSAAIFYEGLNEAAGVRLRAAEYLRLEDDVIKTAVVVFSQVPASG